MTHSRQILFLTHRVPYPPDKGDRIRTFHTLRFLSQRYQVYLACLADEPVERRTRDELEEYCEQVSIIPNRSATRKLRMAWSLLTGRIASVTAFDSQVLRDVLKSWTDEIDFNLALTSASSMGPYLEEPGLRNVPAVVDLVDVDSEKWRNYAEASRVPMRWVYSRESTSLRRYEQQIAGRVKAVLLVSEAESKLFQSIAPSANIQTVTNGVDLDYFQPTPFVESEHRCVFVGALDYHPNIDAVCWFASQVWPEVYRKHQDARFQIVGRNPAPSVMALGKIPGIEVVGQVPDVRPYVQEASVTVAPLRIARGLQNKVLEAFALAKPVIASPGALAGLRLKVSNPAMKCETIEQWHTAIEVLFSNKERRQELARQGREYVETYYHWDRCLEPLEQIIESISDVNVPAPKPIKKDIVAV